MFQLDTKPTYWWPVVVRLPNPDKPGEITEHRFEAQFAWQSDDEHDALLADAHERKLNDTVAMATVLKGIRKIAGADGKPMESTPENIALVLQHHGSHIARAYFDSRHKAAQKNS
jgi:hypothetical protein